MKYLSYKKNLLPLVGALTLVPLFASAAPATAMADNTGIVKGQIDISLTVTAGCQVKPISSSSTTQGHLADDSQWMNIILPNQDLGFDQASKQIDVECTADATPSLTLDGGKNGTGNVRNMVNSNGTKLAYILSSDPQEKSPILPNQAVNPPANGDYTIYASTTIPPKIAVGAYSDTVQATLTW